VRNVLNLN